MANTARPPRIVGNWKMHKTIEETVAFIEQLKPLVQNTAASTWLAVPFTSIHAASEAAKGSSIQIGAQNMNDANAGAFTGEIAARMLLDAGAHFVLLGHSERRKLFGETNAFIHKKIVRALEEGLEVILCIGEEKQARNEGKTGEVLTTQLKECLQDLSADQLAKVAIAYEPVWAIGGIGSATAEQAKEAHALCREWFKAAFNEQAADALVILYGGSVTADNAKALLSEPGIDGLLVGGASLEIRSFSTIITS